MAVLRTINQVRICPSSYIFTHFNIIPETAIDATICIKFLFATDKNLRISSLSYSYLHVLQRNSAESVEEAEFLHGTQSAALSGYVDFSRKNSSMSVNSMINLKERQHISEKAEESTLQITVKKREGKSRKKHRRILIFLVCSHL